MGQTLTTGAVLPLVILIAALALGGYFLARRRALASAQGDSRKLHSLPSYYGYNAVMSVAVPALSSRESETPSTASKVTTMSS